MFFIQNNKNKPKKGQKKKNNKFKKKMKNGEKKKIKLAVNLQAHFCYFNNWKKKNELKRIILS